MGLCAYLLGFSIPTIIGSIALAVYIMKTMYPNEPLTQYEHTENRIQKRETTRTNYKEMCIKQKNKDMPPDCKNYVVIGKIESGTDSVSDPICSICREETNEREQQKLKCRHVFHSKCIDKLLLRNMTTCPNCRASIL